MKAELAFKYFKNIVDAHENTEVANRIQSAIRMLGIESNTRKTWIEKKIFVNELTSDLTIIDLGFPYFNYEFIKIKNANFRYLSKELADLINNIFIDSDGDSSLQIKQLENLLQRHKTSISALKNVLDGLKLLGFDSDPFEEIRNPILVITIPETKGSSADSISRAYEAVDRLIHCVQRTIKEEVSEVEVLAISASRISSFFSTSSYVAAAISAIISFGLNSYKSILEIEANKYNLSKLSGEFIRNEQQEDIKSKIASACKIEVAKRLVAIHQQVDEMELQNACKEALNLIHDGYGFRVLNIDIYEDDDPEIRKLADFTTRNAEELIKLEIAVANLKGKMPRLTVSRGASSEE